MMVGNSKDFISFIQLSFLMYTSYFVLFGHFFYHAYLNQELSGGIDSGDGKGKHVSEGVTIISAETHDSRIRKLKNKNLENECINRETVDTGVSKKAPKEDAVEGRQLRNRNEKQAQKGKQMQ